MEILKALSTQNSQIFSGSSVFPIINSIKSYRNRNPPNFRRSFFTFPLKISPIFPNFPLHSSRNFRVSANSDRTTKRRKNHLRKKLVEQQVRENPTSNHDISPILENPVRKIDRINDSLSNLGNFDDDNHSDNSKVSDNVDASISNNVLWNQLESWSNQYKAEAEFWGIGSNPIFTVFQDSNNKIVKVNVNEDEILRRSRIEPSIYKLKEVEHVKEVQDKISHAKFLAREMEIGNNVLPPNTSVAKFVSSSAKSGFHDTIQNFAHKPGIVPKLSKIGLSVFCGFLVFLALKRFFRKEKGVEEEYSSLEKEMLRRKIKARMAKEKSIKGSVEVIQDSKELGMVFTERPQLDKEELMNSFVKVKAAHDSNSMDFDGKIQEIRTMARHAREIEKTDHNTSNVEDNGTVSNVPNEKEVIHIEPTSIDVPQGDSSRSLSELSDTEKGDIENSHVSKLEVPNNDQSVAQGVEDKRSNLLDTEALLEKQSVGGKPRIISSVKEAREYISKKKLDKKEKTEEDKVAKFLEVPTDPKMDDNGESFGFSGSSAPARNKTSKNTNLGEKANVLTKNADSKDEKEGCAKGIDSKAGELGRANREKWMEDNFYELEPMVEKIRGGFRKNYMVAREKVKEDVNMVSELNMLERDENESEFEWMKDEKLREIVFQVRENELMGRDPFYLLDAEDKASFFKGLEKKVEKENAKLRDLHEYLHSNIENLDYGADGISLYDPPEKIIPRWKGPPPATVSQEFLDDYSEQRKALFAETFGNSNLVKRDPQNSLQSTNEKVESGNLKSSRTVIEGSDGSIKPGKKSGKEFWQHTKKWSRGFIDSYNAENDPEIKAVMKDIGKDLDRWITEKEIQDAATIMDKVPDKGKKFIAEKINKVKREMELFGPQAVVSKYSEYGDEEEVDYYWWLDLPFVLCIELYIDGDGDQRIGFYSLEMASDLELDPKPHHIIAFEDAGDCKNLCYIIQAHMEMLGNGNAFVVPQLPKDTYREAKANGFNVTVIRKGELKLDVDQTLEEVEEKIAEIGSKMYHDKIMKGRNVDVDSIMKGVFGLKKPTKRRRSKKLKKPTK